MLKLVLKKKYVYTAFALILILAITIFPLGQYSAACNVSDSTTSYLDNSYSDNPNSEIFCSNTSSICNAYSEPFNSTLDISKLYAKYAVLIDGDNGRILAGKNEHDAAPMASTTKIMTCITALEYCSPNFICTTSAYASSMPDVQLNATRGEMFELNDLLYSLMLKSHNDTAVIVAENTAYNYICNVLNGKAEDHYSIISKKVAQNISPDTSTSITSTPSLFEEAQFLNEHINYDSSFLSSLSDTESKFLVSIFTNLMNEKALELNCTDTHFVTPNGLDGEDAEGIHHTTALDLATIMSYCIKNKDFLKITQTKEYTFTSIEKKSLNNASPNPSDSSTDTNNSSTNSNIIHNGITYSVNNANAFLNMYDNIISGKTGFTGDAGYCYICAYQCDGRTFIVALLACGWPNNKTYKWHDCRLLLDYARNNYYYQQIIDNNFQIKNSTVINGLSDTIHNYINETYGMLLSVNDVINVVINIPDTINAPIKQSTTTGSVDIYVNDSLVKKIPVYSSDTVQKTTYVFFVKNVLNKLLFIDKNQ